MLIAASLSPFQSELNGLMQSVDISATLSILKAFGLQNEAPYFKGPLSCETPLQVNAKASGSTLRFLIPLALLFDQPITFTGEDRLPERSLDAYARCFKDHPVRFSRHQAPWLPLTVQGPLKPGTFTVDASLSSQFVSGLMVALPLLPGDSKIILEGKIASEPYIQMTLEVLRKSRIEITYNPPEIIIPGYQTYQPIQETVEGDYSHSIFFLAGALMNGDLTMHNLNPTSIQGDQKGLEWLQAMGGNITWNHTHLTVNTSTLQPFNGSLEHHPDLAPMLMALAASIPLTSHFYDLERLNHKESRRLDAMVTLLKRMNIDVTGDASHLQILGQPHFHLDGAFHTHADHRLAMTLLMMAAKAHQPYIVRGVECVDKSYPEFLDVYRAIGGRFETIGDHS
jgi:3-phosphoshikimate 1-carboxyvinyltransferase